MNAARHFIDDRLLAARKSIDDDIQLWWSRKKHPGLEFDGSIVAAFWGKTLDGYVKEIAATAFEAAKDIAETNKFDPVATMRDAGDAAENEIHFTVRKMARIDRSMRGKGNPSTIPERDTSFELQQCLKRLAARTTAEVEAAKARSRDFVTLPLSSDQGLWWYFRNCSHSGRFAVVSLLVAFLGAGFFAGQTDFFRRAKELFEEPPKIEWNNQPTKGDAAKAKANVTTK